MELDYKPNSHKYREAQQKNTPETDEKRIKDVVTTNVKLKKRKGAAKLADIFITEDISNVKTYIFEDVLIPTIAKTLVDIITDSANMIFLGKTGRSKTQTYKPNGYVSYSSTSRDRDDRFRERPARSNRPNLDEIYFEYAVDAEKVLDSLNELIEAYDVARVADLYDSIHVTCQHTDYNYGWTNLSSADVIKTRDGYLLKLPRAVPLSTVR